MRARLALLVLALAQPVTGCATLRATMAGYAEGPAGIARSQQRLRDALAGGEFPVVLESREDDALLRVMTSGLASYYAAQYARSAMLLDTAALLADDRITKSLSKEAAALLTNDMARAYVPRRTERLFIPYYAMLSYARLENWEAAAVEARRLTALLAQYDADRDDGERSLHAGMHLLASIVFERAGERDASLVSRRAGGAVQPGIPERTAPRAELGEGEIVVVLERGFVAHRTTETISLWLNDGDRDSLRNEHHRGHVLSRLTSAVLRRDGHEKAPSPREKESTTVTMRHPVGSWLGIGPSRPREDDDDDDHRVVVAFAGLRRSAQPWGGEPRLLADGSTSTDARMVVSVDDASSVDERRERSAMLARAVARATAKYAVTKAVKDRKGEVAGTIASLGANLLERADVRSWHLLPQQLVILHARVPAGTRTLAIDVGSGSAVRRVHLGFVTVRPGTTSLVATRLWRDPAPSAEVAASVIAAMHADLDCDEIDCR